MNVLPICKKQKIGHWNYVCPFPRMSPQELERYKNLGDNFTEFPTYISITKEKIELNEYDFVGMYTNNSNNTVFDGYRSECK